MPKEIIEVQLMDEYHWLPQEIAKIPYKKLQKILIIKNQKNASTQNKMNIEKFKREHQHTSGSGQNRRFTREV